MIVMFKDIEKFRWIIWLNLRKLVGGSTTQCGFRAHIVKERGEEAEEVSCNNKEAALKNTTSNPFN